jgi:hypothetical protein
MEPSFREMFEGMKQTADGLILANQGIKRMADAALLANDDHDDLRETVRQMETLVMDQSAQIRGLRDELRALRDELRRPPNG